MSRIAIIPLLALLLTACGPEESATSMNEQWSQQADTSTELPAVLAQAQGETLTDEMVRSVLYVGAFVADHEFNAEDVKKVREQLVVEFNKLPQEQIENYRHIQSFAKLIRESKDKAQLAAARQAVYTAWYYSMRRHPLTEVILAYNPALGEYSDKMLLVNYHHQKIQAQADQWLAQQLDIPYKASDSQTKKAVLDYFAARPVEASLIDYVWQRGMEYWDDLDAAEKAQLQADIQASADKRKSTAGLAQSLIGAYLESQGESELANIAARIIQMGQQGQMVSNQAVAGSWAKFVFGEATKVSCLASPSCASVAEKK